LVSRSPRFCLSGLELVWRLTSSHPGIKRRQSRYVGCLPSFVILGLTLGTTQAIYAIQIFYYLSVFCVKMSIMCLYLRICKISSLFSAFSFTLAYNFLLSRKSTGMVLESKYCYNSLAGCTVCLYNPCYSSSVSSHAEILESELARDLHRYQCFFLLCAKSPNSQDLTARNRKLTKETNSHERIHCRLGRNDLRTTNPTTLVPPEDVQEG
jgi:hypothetical protein